MWSEITAQNSVCIQIVRVRYLIILPEMSVPGQKVRDGPKYVLNINGCAQSVPSLPSILVTLAAVQDAEVDIRSGSRRPASRNLPEAAETRILLQFLGRHDC